MEDLAPARDRDDFRLAPMGVEREQVDLVAQTGTRSCQLVFDVRNRVEEDLTGAVANRAADVNENLSLRIQFGHMRGDGIIRVIIELAVTRAAACQLARRAGGIGCRLRRDRFLIAPCREPVRDN